MGSTRTAVVGMSIALMLLSVVGLAQHDATPFSREERRRLLARELVTRPRQWRREGGHYLGGTSFQRVRAPREAVWAAVTRTNNYPDLIPGVDRVRTIVDGGDRRVVYLHHSYSFVSIGYYAVVHIDRNRWTIRFDLDRTRPNDVRDGRGFITVDRYRDRESVVTWGVMADVGSGILTGVLTALLRDRILRVPSCVRNLVELHRPDC